MVVKRPNRILGGNNDAFWDGCARQELRLPRCTLCRTLAWPIEPACTTCGGERFDWERLSGRGNIVSWCTFERDYYQGRFPLPWECILVELEEGALLISNPDGLTWRDMRVGLPVAVGFLDCEDDAGPFKLPVFMPRDRGETLKTAIEHPRS